MVIYLYHHPQKVRLLLFVFPGQDFVFVVHCSLEACDKAINATQVVGLCNSCAIVHICVPSDVGEIVSQFKLVVMHKHGQVPVFQQGLCLASIVFDGITL